MYFVKINFSLLPPLLTFAIKNKKSKTLKYNYKLWAYNAYFNIFTHMTT